MPRHSHGQPGYKLSKVNQRKGTLLTDGNHGVNVCREMPGHRTESRARALHLLITRRPLCSSAKTADRNDDGIATQAHKSNNPSPTDSSAATKQYEEPPRKIPLLRPPTLTEGDKCIALHIRALCLAHILQVEWLNFRSASL